MTGRDFGSFGMALIILGAIVAIVGPHLSEGGKSFPWYFFGGLSILAGACILYG